ncbi:hypothetical protein [Cribrihabitans pelagius]|uniref:Nmad3 family putative nucleotide modification protein n=1 Tax=Cribrihabitans pelagius TaxID=1765746 RepID=UPI003B5BB66C
MKIIFSRKGFDSSSGGGPSPIIGSVPVSLPIPGAMGEPFCFADLSHPAAGPLGPLAAQHGKGGITTETPAHHDPQIPWEPGLAVLGQQGAAQAHLVNQGAGPGDVFVFFGLFRDFSAPREDPDARAHHRIFAMMRITELLHPGAEGAPGRWRHFGLPGPHPHTDRPENLANNALWLGEGRLARNASAALRMTVPSASPSLWQVPEWLVRHGLSYHGKPERWQEGNRLRIASRGQEFVCDPGDDPAAADWAATLWAHLGKMAKPA